LGRVEYEIFLDDEGKVRLRRRHETEKGKVKEFLVQLEVKVRGTWKPVIRYDCAHGFAHADVFDIHGRSEKVRLPSHLADFNEALTYAELDVKENWKKYIEKFLKGRKR